MTHFGRLLFAAGSGENVVVLIGVEPRETVYGRR